MHIPVRLISLVILASSVFVSAAPGPDGGENSCSSCWDKERNKLSQCQNIPKSELEEFLKCTDAEIIKRQADFPHVLDCLCTLVDKTTQILDTCKCSKDDAKGLHIQGDIVEAVCKKAGANDPKPEPNTKDPNKPDDKPKDADKNEPDKNTNSTTSGGSGGSGSSSGDAPTNTTGSTPSPAPLASAAIPVQWTGAFIVTLGVAFITALTL
jgi:hypothetical protein